MYSSKSFIILRLFSFLLFDTKASATPSGTANAKYPNTSTILVPSENVGQYIASGIGQASHSYATASSQTGSAGHVSVQHNATQPTDDCWPQWSRYWDMSSKVKTMYTTFTTERVYNSVTGWSIPAWYTTSEVTSTVTEGNGNFPTKTYVTTITTSQKIAQTFVTTEASTTDVVTDQISTTITRPACSMASYVPQCQSSWLSWGSNGAVSYDQPACTQASVSGVMCSSVLSQWLNYQRAELGEISGKVGMQWLPETNNGTTVWPTSTTNYYWPTSSTVAPGCTVGCQSCRVSGSRVKLLYWPPATSGLHNATHITGTGSSKPVVTAITDGTTLTSPTVYISFDKLHASDSCSVIGKTLSNIIVAVTNSATLSSLYGWDRYWGLQQTASFNFTDLYSTPVPHSIYMSQPRCASSSISLVYSCAPLGANAPAACSTSNTPLLCATTLPYEPVIAIPKEVQQLQPDWGTCIGGIIGVYDPPQALHQAVSAARATMPTDPKTTQQADSSPDATTPATTSPTISRAPPPTHAVETTQQSSSTWVATSPSDQPEEAGSQSASAVAPIAGNSVVFSQPAGSEQSQASTTPVPSDPPTEVDSTSKNALDVLTAAESQISIDPDTTTADSGPSDPTIMPWSPPPSSGETNSPAFTYDPSMTESQNTPMSWSTVVTGSGGPLPLSSDDPTDADDNSPTFTFDPSTPPDQTPGATQPQPTLAIITASDQTFSAVQQGSHVVIIDASDTQTLIPGQETIIDNSQTVKLQEPQTLIAGTSTIPLQPAPPIDSTPGSATPAAAMWTASDDQTFSAFSQKSNIIVAGPSTTATLPKDPTGTAAILEGQTLSILPSNNGIIVDGSSIAIPPPAPSSLLSALSASNTNAIILADPSTTATLTRGQETTLGSHTVSVPMTGGGVVVDGSSTVIVQQTSLPVLATAPSSTSSTSSSSTQGDETSTSSASPPISTTASSSAWSLQSRAWDLGWLYSFPLIFIAYIL